VTSVSGGEHLSWLQDGSEGSLRAALREVAPELAARTMVGRNGVAEDFAGPAVFLASRASAYVTGQSIFVDGGLSVH
jgi:NAD(P)-dependent dehydrogenase (short-subunit alcohol dehydrogenase family)